MIFFNKPDSSIKLSLFSEKECTDWHGKTIESAVFIIFNYIFHI